MDKKTIILLLIVGLVVLAGVQAIQINELAENFGDENYPNSGGSSSPISSNSKPSTEMVGGC